MFEYIKECKEENGSIEFFYTVKLKNIEIATFLVSKFTKSFGSYIVLESFEIEEDYRNKGFSTIILTKINSLIKELKVTEDLFLFLEPIPYKKVGLKSDGLIRIYSNGLNVKYMNSERVMIKSFKKELSEEDCLFLILENNLI